MCAGAGAGAGAGALDWLRGCAGAEMERASGREGLTGASARDWARALDPEPGGAGASSEGAIGWALTSPVGTTALTEVTGRLGGGDSARAAEPEGSAREMAKEQANMAHPDSTMSGLRRPTRTLRRVAGWAPSLPG